MQDGSEAANKSETGGGLMIPHPAAKLLREYQQAFVDGFLSRSSERAHLLTAPSGSGARTCVVEIVFRLLTDKSMARVLLLSERTVLIRQWMQRFRDAAVPARSLEGSRHNLRELTWGEHHSAFAWSPSSIVMMLTGSVQRFDDLRASVFQTPWDLTVWDGFAFSPGKLALLRELGETQSVQRILVMNHNQDANWHDLIPGMNRTTWDWNLLLRSTGESPSAPITSVLVTYQRTPEEVELRARLEKFVKMVTSDSKSSKLVSQLRRAADSSPASLRERLRQFYPSKASIAVGELSEDDHLEPQDADDELDDGPEQLTLRNVQYLDEVRNLQESLDDLSVDSKLEAMLKYVADRGSHQSHIIVWCKFAATARYVKSALTESDRDIFLITAVEQPSERLNVLEEFAKRGGFLISTFAAMKGLECSADSIILYDALVQAPRTALSILLQRVDNRKPADLVSLADESEATTFNQDILRDHE
jgi:hypothetical protein